MGNASYTYDSLDNLRTLTRSGQAVVLGYCSDNRINAMSVNGANWLVSYNPQGAMTKRGSLSLN